MELVYSLLCRCYDGRGLGATVAASKYKRSSEAFTQVENASTRGDVTRTWLRAGESPPRQGVSSYFSCCNWGKQSIAVHLSQPGGVRVVHDLVAKSDVVLASFKVRCTGALPVVVNYFVSLDTLFPFYSMVMQRNCK